MYDSKVGRWLSEDPIGFLGGDPNLQRYVTNDAIEFVDPNGLEEKPPTNGAAQDFAFIDPAVGYPFKPNANSLSWGHFSELPTRPPGETADARTSFFFPPPEFKPQVFRSNGQFEVTLEVTKIGPARFMPFSSWVLAGKKTEALLEHERLHLRMAEIASEIIKTEMLGKQFTGIGETLDEAYEAAKDGLESRFEELIERHDSIQRAYDSETNKSRNVQMQLFWEHNCEQQVPQRWYR